MNRPRLNGCLGAADCECPMCDLRIRSFQETKSEEPKETPKDTDQQPTYDIYFGIWRTLQLTDWHEFFDPDKPTVEEQFNKWAEKQDIPKRWAGMQKETQ